MDNLGDLRDQHIEMIDRVGARDFLHPFQPDQAHRGLFHLDVQLVVPPILVRARGSQELVLYVER